MQSRQMRGNRDARYRVKSPTCSRPDARGERNAVDCEGSEPPHSKRRREEIKGRVPRSSSDPVQRNAWGAIDSPSPSASGGGEQAPHDAYLQRQAFIVGEPSDADVAGESPETGRKIQVHSERATGRVTRLTIEDRIEKRRVKFRIEKGEGGAGGQISRKREIHLGIARDACVGIRAGGPSARARTNRGRSEGVNH